MPDGAYCFRSLALPAPQHPGGMDPPNSGGAATSSPATIMEWPHEFVVFSPTSNAISSVDDAIRELWPEVDGAFKRIWDGPDPTKSH